MRHLIPLLLLLAACPDVDDDLDPGAPAIAPVDDDRLGAEGLLTHLEALDAIALAHDGHRALGSPGYDASVDYVVDQLQALGLSPRREPFDVTSWRAESATLHADDDAVPTVALSWSGSGAAQGSLVGVDLQEPPGDAPNSSTSGCEAADFDTFPPGAVALLQRGTCTFTTKAVLAEQAGASAVVIYNEGQRGRRDILEGSLDEEAGIGIPVLGIAYEAAAVMLAATQATATVDARIDLQTSTNVLVDLPGTSGRRWAVGAHLDSVPEGPGINDNGTGVALLLQLAAVYADQAPQDLGLRLAWWGGEELGLLGSLAHVRDMTEADLAATAGYLNFDMIGSPNPARFIYDGDGSSFAIPPGLPEVAANAGIEALFADHFDARGLPTDLTPYDGRSDYLGFALAGLPTGGLFTGAEAFMSEEQAERYGGEGQAPFDACYHGACDTLDNLDTVVLEEMARATADVVSRLLDTDPATLRQGPWSLPQVRPVPVRAPHGGCHHDVSR